MKITGMKTYIVGQPAPHRGGRNFVFLKLMTDEGISGWGEASPGNAPISGAEWAGGVFGCLRDWLAPAVVGNMVESGE